MIKDVGALDLKLDALHGEQASIRELAELASVSEGVLRGMLRTLRVGLE